MALRSSLIVAVLCVACSTQSEVGPETEATSSGDEVVAAAQPSLAVAPVTLPPEDADGGRAEVEAEVPEELTEDERLLLAIEAAQNAEGDTICEVAYNGAIAMVEALQGQVSTGPTRNQFITGCNALPVAAQRCMTMAYAMANQTECDVVMRSAPIQQFRDDMRPSAP